MTCKAMVVEDDLDLAIIFTEAMQAAGFQVETIQNGSQAARRLTQTVPDVVVLDLHLPGMSGKSILKQIRADARLDKACVILATADARLADTFQEEADLVLVKPVSFNQLRDLAIRLKSNLPAQV